MVFLRIGLILTTIAIPQIHCQIQLSFGDWMSIGSIIATSSGTIYWDRDNVISILTGEPNLADPDLIAANLRRLRTTLENLARSNESIIYLEAISDIIRDIPLQLELKDIIKEIMEVETFNENMIKYSQSVGKFENITILSFAKLCVSHGPRSLMMAMERLHSNIVPTSNQIGMIERLTTSFVESEISHICRYEQSPNHLLYNLLQSVVLAEIKGFATMQYAWMLLKKFGQGSFSEEIAIAKQKFENRMNSTLLLFKFSMDRASREIIKCEPHNPEEGKSYERITNFRQGYIDNEINMGSDQKCDASCKNHKNEKQERCEEGTLCERQRKCKGELETCSELDADFDSHMTICFAPKGSERIYDWIQLNDEYGEGDKRICKSEKHKMWANWKSFFTKCLYCACICNDKAGPKSDRYFSLKEVIADVRNNKVVTGLRFAKAGRIISLQISEARLLQGGFVDTHNTWIPIKEETFEAQIKGVHYHELTKKERAVDLHNLEGRKDHVLTGVRLKIIKGRLNFQIHTTPFNYSSGELYADRSIWSHSRRSTSQIDITNLDIPIRSQEISIPISHSGQYLEFEPTSFQTDLAQNTVPYIDIQPVISKSSVPLAGAGLYYKRTEGYGGFIAPKIITYDYGKVMLNQFKFPRQ